MKKKKKNKRYQKLKIMIFNYQKNKFLFNKKNYNNK